MLLGLLFGYLSQAERSGGDPLTRDSLVDDAGRVIAGLVPSHPGHAPWFRPGYLYRWAVRLARSSCPGQLKAFLGAFAGARGGSRLLPCEWHQTANLFSRLMAGAARSRLVSESWLRRAYRIYRRLPAETARPLALSLLSNPETPSSAVVGILEADGKLEARVMGHPNLPRRQVRAAVARLLSGSFSGDALNISWILASNPSVDPDDLVPLLLSGNSALVSGVKRGLEVRYGAYS